MRIDICLILPPNGSLAEAEVLTHSPRPEMPLTSRQHTLLLARDNEARQLQRLLDDACDKRDCAEMRAGLAERERDALRAQLARFKAT
jgi:hypothetical protein